MLPDSRLPLNPDAMESESSLSSYFNAPITLSEHRCLSLQINNNLIECSPSYHMMISD